MITPPKQRNSTHPSPLEVQKMKKSKVLSTLSVSEVKNENRNVACTVRRAIKSGVTSARNLKKKTVYSFKGLKRRK